MVEQIATARGGDPFDPASLTEDYELGLRIAALGGRTTLARVFDATTGDPVAVRAYFPSTIPGAVRQKARWMTGIALAGWDRLGWGPIRDWRDHWMRMRDRRGPIAVVVLATAYLALVAWAVSQLAHTLLLSESAPVAPTTEWLLRINGCLLAWRLAVRAAFTGRAYGWREACWSVPRALVGNGIALLAARRALFSYVGSLRGATLRWDKTAHVFPDFPGTGR